MGSQLEKNMKHVPNYEKEFKHFISLPASPTAQIPAILRPVLHLLMNRTSHFSDSI